MSEKETINTSAGPVTAEIENTNGVLQINVHWLPGKRFGLFAVYDEGDLVLFREALAEFVDVNLESVQSDQNISMLMSGCIAAGTGPDASLKIKFGTPEVSHADD